MADRPTYGRATVLWIASALTYGLGTFVAVGFGVLMLLGNEPLGPVATLLALLVPLLVAAKVTDEATRVRLHGWTELRRGSPGRRLLRHAILLLPVAIVGGLGLLVVLGTVTSLPTLLGDPTGRYSWAVWVLGAFALVFGWVLFRTVTAYREGRYEAAVPMGLFRK